MDLETRARFERAATEPIRGWPKWAMGVERERIFTQEHLVDNCDYLRHLRFENEVGELGEKAHEGATGILEKSYEFGMEVHRKQREWIQDLMRLQEEMEGFMHLEMRILME